MRRVIKHLWLVALALVATAAVLAYISGLLPPDVYAAGSNGTWKGVAFALGGTALIMYARHGRAMGFAAKCMVIGAIIGFTGTEIHRLFWNSSIWTRPEGALFAEWTQDWRWVPAMAVALIALGGWFGLRPYAPDIYGPHWSWYYVLVLLIPTVVSGWLAM